MKETPNLWEKTERPSIIAGLGLGLVLGAFLETTTIEVNQAVANLLIDNPENINEFFQKYLEASWFYRHLAGLALGVSEGTLLGAATGIVISRLQELGYIDS